MALEVQSGHYHFKPDPKKVVRATLFNQLMRKETPAEVSSLPPRNPTTVQGQQAAVHNYLHDIESLFWMANFALFSSIPDTVNTWDSSVDAQRSAYLDLFPHQMGHCDDRFQFFTNVGTNERRAATLLSDKSVACVDALGQLSSGLVDQYVAFYADVEGYRLRHVFLDIYSVLETLFEGVQKTVIPGTQTFRALKQRTTGAPVFQPSSPLQPLTPSQPTRKGKAPAAGPPRTSQKRRANNVDPEDSARRTKRRTSGGSQHATAEPSSVGTRRSARLAKAPL